MLGKRETLMKSTTGDMLLVGQIMIRPYIFLCRQGVQDFLVAFGTGRLILEALEREQRGIPLTTEPSLVFAEGDALLAAIGFRVLCETTPEKKKAHRTLNLLQLPKIVLSLAS